jgi:2-isopropylmalate synthase
MGVILKCMQTDELVHNWGGYNFKNKKITVFDTTLRDALQSPHAQHQPTLSQKLIFLDAAYEVGIDAMEIGFPISSESHKKEVIELAKHAVKNKMGIKLSCLSRTTPQDVQAVIDVSQAAGAPVTANILVGSSKIRRLVENWDLDQMLGWIKKSINLAHTNNIEAEFVTEDGTRTDPETLLQLYGTAIETGVKRVWIADTVGDATPNSAKNIVEYFVNDIFKDKKIGLDWHGHDDKGLGVANSLAAVEAGADRIQGTSLGIGERAGNTPLEPVMINLNLAGATQYNLKVLKKYTQAASDMFSIPIREGYPGIGKYVHSTAAGMHAAAIVKARRMKREDLVGLVYAPFHADLFDEEISIYIGPLSGRANVEWNLERLKLEATIEQMDRILLEAKEKNRFLSDDEIKSFLRNT